MKENTPLSPEARAVLGASHTDPQVVADILLAVMLKCVYTDDYGASYIDPRDLLAITEDRVSRARAALGQSRRCIYNPVQIAECGGPCEQIGPEACDCGALWVN